MKKTILSLALSAVCITALMAQQAEPTSMVIVQKDGTTTTYQLADIDSVYFNSESTAPKAYKIEIPTDFSTGNIQKVMADNQQVAEICSEYVRSWVGSGNVVDNVLTVLYPMGSDGKADIRKGLASDGSIIEWDLEADSVANYVAGSAAFTSVYLTEDGQFVNSLPEGTEEVATTITPYLLKDVRSKSDSQTYKIVKIGTQYWMAENLKAVTLRNGTSIKLYTTGEADDWASETNAAYHIYTDDTEYCWPDYGAMYNGYAVMSEGGLAPEGWEVSSLDQWQSLKNYLKSTPAAKVKGTQYWATPGTNLSGLGITPGGYFSRATGDDMEGSRVYYWTSDRTTSYGSPALKMVFIANSMTLTAEHNYYFGHYVRCVRK